MLAQLSILCQFFATVLGMLSRLCFARQILRFNVYDSTTKKRKKKEKKKNGKSCMFLYLKASIFT